MPRKTATATPFTDTAHNVWLAGLGALASAGHEGEKLFKTLVARGARLEKTMVRPAAGLQPSLEDCLESALHRVGVPTRKEIAVLSRRVEKLSRAVSGNGSSAATPRRTARKTAARKTTTRSRTAKRAQG